MSLEKNYPFTSTPLRETATAVVIKGTKKFLAFSLFLQQTSSLFRGKWNINTSYKSFVDAVDVDADVTPLLHPKLACDAVNSADRSFRNFKFSWQNFCPHASDIQYNKSILKECRIRWRKWVSNTPSWWISLQCFQWPIL